MAFTESRCTFKPPPPAGRVAAGVGPGQGSHGGRHSAMARIVTSTPRPTVTVITVTANLIRTGRPSQARLARAPGDRAEFQVHWHSEAPGWLRPQCSHGPRLSLV
jgi:hypothetical protein